MKIDELLSEWKLDTIIDSANLVEESRKAPYLHSKYLEYLMNEKKAMYLMQRDVKRLRLELRDHLENPTVEGKAKGFLAKVNPKRRLIKSEYEDITNGDDIITQAEANLDFQKAKVDCLEKIIWEIARRKDHISNIIRQNTYLAGM